MAKGSTLGKDPAISWVFNDWQGGTMTLSRFQKGCYMDLLTAQFNNGHLSLDEIKTVLGSDFGSTWPTLQKKFKIDSGGMFYNERLEFEINKRQKFNKSRRDNLVSTPHMGIGNGKGIGSETEIETKGGPGGNKPFFRIRGKLVLQPVSEYFLENFSIFHEQWKMKHPPDISAQVFEELDTKYHSTDFSNQNHVKNAFTTTWNRLKNGDSPQTRNPKGDYLSKKTSINELDSLTDQFLIGRQSEHDRGGDN